MPCRLASRRWKSPPSDTLQVHDTERSPEAHLLNGSYTSVSDAETKGLIERGTICLFDVAEQLR